MKIRISIPQIRCLDVTHPRTNADEVYVAYAVGLGRPKDGHTGGEKAIVGGQISTTIGHIRKGRCWRPEPNSLKAELDLGDAKLAYVAVALYEKDDGRLYDELSQELKGILTPPKFQWSDVRFPTDVTSFEAWVKTVWKALVMSLKYFRQDDYLGRHDIVVLPEGSASDTADDWQGTREIKFKRYGGDYRVTIALEEA